MHKQVTSEDAVNKIGNRYELVLIATIRARELKRGYKPFVIGDNKNIVTALEEIEQGKIGREYLNKISRKQK
jgi:DNA-directed RNA polymerase subunit omega